VTCRCAPIAPLTRFPDYFVCLIDYRSAGAEATVDPTVTRADIISRLKSREYRDVLWIHHVHDGRVDDVTMELIGEARNLILPDDSPADRQAWAHDHARDERKHAEPA
jgi:hypothetical protein